MPGERTHNLERAIPLVTVYDPDEDYAQPTIDIDAVTKVPREPRSLRSVAHRTPPSRMNGHGRRRLR